MKLPILVPPVARSKTSSSLALLLIEGVRPAGELSQVTQGGVAGEPIQRIVVQVVDVEDAEVEDCR